MRAVIKRHIKTDKETLGKLLAYNDSEQLIFQCLTLENNSVIIPTGKYRVVETFSNRFKKYLYEILNVSGRSGIRIHSMNYYYQSQGCIGVGMSLADLDKDGQQDVTNSAITYNTLREKLGKEFELDIIDVV